MIKILTIISSSILLFSSCKKAEDPKPKPASNTWVLGGSTHVASAVGFKDFTFSASEGNSINGNFYYLIFSEIKRPEAGTYKIVDGFRGIGTKGEVIVGAYNLDGDRFFESTGTTSAVVTVTVNNEKISVSVPEIFVREVGEKDSLKFSAALLTEE